MAKFIITAAATWTAVYLLAAFVQWTLDPAAWSMDARFGCVLIGTLASGMACAIVGSLGQPA